MSEGATTRKCSSCGEWYDARASSCYFCNQEERETNQALKKAVETAQLNGALSGQMQEVQAERSAEQMLRSARSDPSGRAYASARPRVPGYGGLVNGLKDSLENHPEVLDYFANPD